MDQFDLMENVSLLDENNKVTLIVGEEEAHLDKSRALHMRDWLTGWLHEPSK